MRKTHNLAQLQIDEFLKVGDTVVDATINGGDATRFLASRVGDDGHVLAFSAHKKEIDEVAASLFLSGLTARVELIEKNFSIIPQYLNPAEPVAVFLFQTEPGLDAQALVQTIQRVQLYLKSHGLIVLDGHLADPAIVQTLAYAQTLPADAYDVRYFTDPLSMEAALLIQRL